MDHPRFRLVLLRDAGLVCALVAGCGRRWRRAKRRNGRTDGGPTTATGLGSEVGVFVQAVPAGSQAATDQFQALDVILSLNGQAVGSLTDLNSLYAKTTSGQTLSFGIFRSQKDQTLTITR